MSLRVVPVDWRDAAEHRRLLADAANQIADGRSNAFGSVTLAANQATTTLTDIRIGTDTVISLTPTTANAAAEIGAGTLYIGTVTGGSATITHANNAQSDRTFAYSLQG